MARPTPHAGRSIMDIFWQELDEIMDWLKENGKPETFEPAVVDYRECAVVEPKENGDPSDYQEWAERRGQAQGVAYCLAVLTNPYAPNIDTIRAEARARWEQRNGE
jgi:hypothetical protein